ncbi:hypothetical protein RF11_14752 [Thelohanellus kitauei]|uniref:Uncharacterized protein n=1 Tax=Thelohanellus kitauei TaxID=669202 RepID=A0A0C2MPF5_THEKT|nr:hypothetical protein RF11_14752 [Thelohanellus kitauei]
MSINTPPVNPIDNPNVDESLNTGNPIFPRGRFSFQKISNKRRQQYYKKIIGNGKNQQRKSWWTYPFPSQRGDKNLLRELVEENCRLSFKANISERFYTIRYYMIRNNNKQLGWINALERNDPYTISIRNDFAHSFVRLEEDYSHEQIYFVYETRFNVSMRIKKG